jgi:hypothetical protein
MAGAQAAGTISLTQVGSYMFLKFVSGFTVLQCLATFCFSMAAWGHMIVDNFHVLTHEQPVICSPES